MNARHRPLAAGLIAIALVVGACATEAAPTPSPAAPTATPVTAQPTVAPTPSPSPKPTPRPTVAPATTPGPAQSAAPSATPSASPGVAVTTVEAYAWVFDKHPLSLRGVAGTSTWTRVLFAAKTVDLRWSAKPAASSDCRFAFQVTSKALAKPVKVSEKVRGAKGDSGTRAMTINYGDGAITVDTTCASWSIKASSTGHPGLTIKQGDDPYTVKATTVDELNDGLGDAQVDWSFRWSYKYYQGATIRVSSHVLTVAITYELPRWNPPEGSDPELVAAWQAAVANMRTHELGEAAIAIQAGGRYLAAAKKTSFASVSALERYYDNVSDRFIDAAGDRTEAYNEFTRWGYDQGAFLD